MLAVLILCLLLQKATLNQDVIVPKGVEKNLDFKSSSETDSWNLDSEQRNCSDDKPNFCSPWVYCENGQCKCGEAPPHQILECTVGNNLTLLESNCVTYDEEEDVFEAGPTMYTITSAETLVHEIPRNISELNNLACGRRFNRRGTLCGKCKEGYYPYVYSFNMSCVECLNGKHNWWKLVLATFLPETIIFLAILFQKMNMVLPHLWTFTYFSQILSIPYVTRILLIETHSKWIQTALRYILVLYGMWNFDLLRAINLEICLKITPLQTLLLDLFIGMYPLLLITVTYLLIYMHEHNFKPLVILFKPLQKIFRFLQGKWELKTSAIDCFSIFFLICNTKLLSVTLDMLCTPVQVYQLNATGHLKKSWRLYYDPTIPYFGKAHLPYALSAIILLLLFELIPSLLLIVYPFRCFHKLLNCGLTFHYRKFIWTFMETFQGSYKELKEWESWDCRRLTALAFLAPFILACIAARTSNTTYLPIAAITLGLMALIYATLQPFKMSHDNRIVTSCVCAASLWYVAWQGIIMAEEKSPKLLMMFFCAVVFIAAVPLLCMYAQILHWIYTNRKFGATVLNRLRARRLHYEPLE